MLDVPYVALPVKVKDISSRLLNQPTAADLERLLNAKRDVVQIVGPGGGGKTTLAKHIGDLALAGGEPGAFEYCRLPVWIDEDFSDLFAVIKGKINSWYESGEEIEETLVRSLLEKGLLLAVIDRVSERSTATQECVSQIHRNVRCNAVLMTTRRPVPMEVKEKRFIYPQELDSATLLNFMTEIIKYHFDRNNESEEQVAVSGSSEERPLSTIKSQLELGNRLAALVAVRSGEKTTDIPILPLPVVLFVSGAVDRVKHGRSLDTLPDSLPDIYAEYLRRVNPKGSGVTNAMDDELMLRTAKALGRFSLGSDYIPKEFPRDRATVFLEAEVADIPAGTDALQRLADNGVLLSKKIGTTSYYRFVRDPVAEFLAAEAYWDACDERHECIEQLLAASNAAPGFHNALLQTVQARGRDRQAR